MLNKCSENEIKSIDSIEIFSRILASVIKHFRSSERVENWHFHTINWLNFS